MKDNIILLVACTLLHGCAVSAQRFDNEPYHILEGSLEEVQKDMVVFPRAFTDNEYDSSFISDELYNVVINYTATDLRNTGLKKIDSIKAISGLGGHIKDSIVELYARKYLKIKVKDFLKPEDIHKMAGMVNRKHIWKEELFNGDIQVSNKLNNALRISLPMLSTQNDIAAYFVESNSSLDIVFCKKNESDKWEFYCSATIWIE